MALPLARRPTGGAQQADEDATGVAVNSGDDAGRGAVQRPAGEDGGCAHVLTGDGDDWAQRRP
ncbi:hypothetical protein E2562_019942 [Oryza meyeriana var. granulata]|uniref:Uncharacterized protein n=1 Tax=Oryza meyeriana var. granulata TaxID=110450 RepID=A0A6G1EMZ7_9ORYZ|nr:hypothetical protein E2562_019942 [Oryza meyeriana var. granulata]